jgi:hypothetical protein
MRRALTSEQMQAVEQAAVATGPKWLSTAKAM